MMMGRWAGEDDVFVVDYDDDDENEKRMSSTFFLSGMDVTQYKCSSSVSWPSLSTHSTCYIIFMSRILHDLFQVR